MHSWKLNILKSILKKQQFFLNKNSKITVKTYKQGLSLNLLKMLWVEPQKENTGLSEKTAFSATGTRRSQDAVNK